MRQKLFYCHKFKTVCCMFLCIIVTWIVYLTGNHLDQLCRTSIVSKLGRSVKIYEEVRVGCLIHTNESQHDDAAMSVKVTWAQRCNQVLFVSDAPHLALEPLVIAENNMWRRLRVSLEYVNAFHSDAFDWLLIAYDINYVILENLRKMLRSYKPDEPISFGFKAKDRNNQPYMLGSFVLSKEALRRFVIVALQNSTICEANQVASADVEMGRCLRNVGVVSPDTRDSRKRQRFVPFTPHKYLTEMVPAKLQWYSNCSFYDVSSEASRKPSPEVISFNNVTPRFMFALHYFIYKFRIFGRILEESAKISESSTLN